MRAYDPEPEAIRAHLSGRDNGWDDDWMGVILDTFNDNRRDLLLVVNPLGVQMDTIETWPGDQAEWDAELRIPFSSLRFQRSAGPQISVLKVALHPNADNRFQCLLRAGDRVDYANARSFLRAILQFVDYDFVSANYLDGRSPTFRHLFSQLLNSYKLNPQTVLFVGYSDNSYNPTGGGLVRADRTLFAKIGYAWVM